MTRQHIIFCCLSICISALRKIKYLVEQSFCIGIVAYCCQNVLALHTLHYSLGNVEKGRPK